MNRRSEKRRRKELASTARTLRVPRVHEFGNHFVAMDLLASDTSFDAGNLHVSNEGHWGLDTPLTAVVILRIPFAPRRRVTVHNPGGDLLRQRLLNPVPG